MVIKLQRLCRATIDYYYYYYYYNRLYSFLEKNNYIEKHYQKGFWPAVDGVAEHTQVLTHILRDAKLHQRSVTVVLLDLKNAFGEIHHNLIATALELHHVPDHIRQIIKNIYTNSRTAVSFNDQVTDFIPVERGVLQGDPCSPLIFNICFNLLMKTVNNKKFENHGYLWGPNANLFERSWLQFADDTALIAHNVKSAQILIDINSAWCKWTGMQLRIDKCQAFGMRKLNGLYSQFLPNLTIDDENVPAVKMNESFKYLGKIFDAKMDNFEAKSLLKLKLEKLLKTTSDLNIKAQLKLKILKSYISSQISFDLRIYDFSYTWISTQLDGVINNHVSQWLDLPISTCISQFMELPKNEGGYGIPSLKSTAEKLRLGLRLSLKNNPNIELNNIWMSTHIHNKNLDTFLERKNTKPEVYSLLLTNQQEKIGNHLSTLKIQGSLQKTISTNFTKSYIQTWSNFLDKLPETFFKFVRKALQQQLPTAANLFRWGKILSNRCSLCNEIQTNKHVLSACGSKSALFRYKNRHDQILDIIAKWISVNLKEEFELFVDIDSFQPLAMIFDTLRPDIAIKTGKSIITLELTICHESNIQSSKTYKLNKYKNLSSHLLPSISTSPLKNFTIEVTTLGLISDISPFLKLLKLGKFPSDLTDQIRNSVIANSYNIYCSRNTAN